MAELNKIEIPLRLDKEALELLERLENVVKNFERIQNPISCVPDCPNYPGPCWCTLPYIGRPL